MAVKLSPVAKASVADMVLEQLLDLFMAGSLKLGDRLPSELELAKQLGSGRNTVREAMKVLQVMGVIERRQGDGSYVATEISVPLKPLLLALFSRMGTTAEMVELRRVLEVGLVDLVIEKASDDDLERLERTIDEYATAIDQPDLATEELVELDLSFHYTMFEITQDGSIIDLGKLIMRLFASSIAAHLSSEGGVTRAVEDHRRILAAIRSRDRDAARTAVIQSYRIWKQHIRI